MYLKCVYTRDEERFMVGKVYEVLDGHRVLCDDETYYEVDSEDKIAHCINRSDDGRYCRGSTSFVEYRDTPPTEPAVMYMTPKRSDVYNSGTDVRYGDIVPIYYSEERRRCFFVNGDGCVRYCDSDSNAENIRHVLESNGGYWINGTLFVEAGPPAPIDPNFDFTAEFSKLISL